VVKLTFYGGVKEIGGNKILLEDQGTKIFLDFGMSFSRRERYFEEFLNPRPSNGIGDFLTMKLLPDISGIYREDLLEHLGRKPEETDIQGVVLSHAHADHANYISFLHKDIPVYCGETCKYILEAVEEQSQRNIESEVLNFKKRPIYKDEYKNPPIEREFKTFRTDDKIYIDSIELEPIHVDHCLTENTLVQLLDGEISKVKNVADCCYINTIDFKNGRNTQGLALKSKHSTSQILKIKTSFGEIESTGEHRFFILDGLDIVEKKAKDLKNGDFLIYSREIDFKGRQQTLPKIKLRKVVKISKEGLNLIKQKRKEKGLSQNQLASEIGLSKFYGDFERGRFGIELNRLYKILEFLAIDIKQFQKKYVFLVDNFKIPSKTSPEFLQLLGYTTGDGSWDAKSKKHPYLEIGDKDRKNLDIYQKIAKSLFNDEGKLVIKKNNMWKLRLSTYIGRLFYKISPFIFSKSHTRKIPSLVHKATIKEIGSFLRGLYDAEGSFRSHTIVLTSTSKELIDTTKLLLLRFGILSWIYEFIEPISKRKAYHLNITNYESIIKFKKFIGFGSEKKQERLSKFIKNNKKSHMERIELIPFNGDYLKNALKFMGLTSWDFQKAGISIGHYTSGRHRPSKNMVLRILDFIKIANKGDKEAKNYYIKKIEKLLCLNTIFIPIKSIKYNNCNTKVYDFEVAGYASFIANGYLVHNSVPGSYGFNIHTSEGTINYTGDLRMHGTHADMTDDFIEVSREAKPIAMITEGTRIDTDKSDESEQKVYDESKRELQSSDKLSIVDFNFKDVDRFNTFYQIAKNLDKKLVISFKHACFLERYHRDSKLKTPDSRDNQILILKPKRLTGTYIDEDYTDWYISRRLNYPNIVTAEEVAKKPRKYIVVLNFYYFNMMIDLKPYGGTYIHSLSEPFNEEMEISYERMHNWLRHFDLRFVQAHCSGHICGSDLKELIQNIKPGVIYPIHTEKPELFKKFDKKTIIVEEGKTYNL